MHNNSARKTSILSFDRNANSTTRAATNNSDHTSQPQGTNLTDSSPEDYSSTVTTKPTKDDNNDSDTSDYKYDTSTTVSQDEGDHTDENITAPLTVRARLKM